MGEGQGLKGGGEDRGAWGRQIDNYSSISAYKVQANHSMEKILMFSV